MVKSREQSSDKCTQHEKGLIALSMVPIYVVEDLI